MNLEAELKKGHVVYFYYNEQSSSITIVVLERGGVYKQLSCPIDLEKFPNLLQALSLNYTIYIKYSRVYTVQLFDKLIKGKVIATFRAAEFYDALTLLDDGIQLYFEQKKDRIVRK